MARVSSIHGYHYARLRVINQINGTDESFVKVVISRYPIGLFYEHRESGCDKCGFL